MAELLVIGVIGGVGVVILIVAVLALRSRSTRNRTLAESLGATDPEGDGSGAGEVDGRPFRYVYLTSTKNRPSSLELSVDTDLAGELCVRGENGFDRIGKWLGLSVEVQTGAVDFDRRWFVASDDRPLAAHVLGDADRRAAFAVLDGLGFGEIRIRGGRVSARISPFSPADDGDSTTDARLREAVSPLTLIAAAPAPPRRPGAVQDPRWRRWIAFGTAGTALIGGFGAMIWGLERYPPLDAGTVFLHALGHYAVPAALLALYLGLRWLGGRASGHRDVLIFVLLALPACVIGSFGTAMVVNGGLDEGEVIVHKRVVRDKTTVKGDDSTSYYIVVDAWREGVYRERLEVSSGFWRRTTPGRTRVRIETRAGRLGFEWLQRIRRLKREAGDT